MSRRTTARSHHPANRPTASGRRWRDTAIALGLLVAGVVFAFTLVALLLRIEGVDAALESAIRRATGSPRLPVALLFVEEAGVPLPVPGDLLVGVLGHRAHSLAAGVAIGAALLVAITIGASILYWIGSRLGHRLLRSRLAPLLDLEPERVERLDGWFRRWGLLAVVVGRWIPGFRVGTTIVAATFDVPYPVFILGVVISSLLWITFFMTLGAVLGRRLAPLIAAHHNFDAAAPLVLGALVLGYLAFRAFQLKRRADRINESRART